MEPRGRLLPEGDPRLREIPDAPLRSTGYSAWPLEPLTDAFDPCFDEEPRSLEGLKALATLGRIDAHSRHELGHSPSIRKEALEALEAFVGSRPRTAPLAKLSRQTRETGREP